MNKKWFGFVLRWIPRVLGAFLFVMLVLFAVGEGIPNPMKQSLAVRVEMLAMFTMGLGLIVAWKSELIGGMLVLTGYTSFCVIEWQAPNIRFPFGLFLFTGLLYVLSWWSKNRQQSGTEPGDSQIPGPAAPDN